MLLPGVVLKSRTLNELDIDLMRRHAATHDRINNLSWQNRSSNGRGYNGRANESPQGYNQDYRNTQRPQQHMKSFPSSNSPGIPPSNAQASQWYQETSVQIGTIPNGGHNSGILRLEDLRMQFGGGSQGGYTMSDHRQRQQGQGFYGRGSRNDEGYGAGSGY
jgi:hypothetical protein